MILPHAFYEQDTTTVAKNLLGCYLAHLEGEQTTLGRIVETEAYLANDPAAHSFVGKTKRNAALFGPAGHAYVYFIYGMHYCFNVVTAPDGVGEGILIRAVEPLQGIALMEQRRGTTKLSLLCSGPSRLAQAFAITLAFNGYPLTNGPLQLWSPDSFPHCSSTVNAEIVQTTRIGIGKARELPLRFYLSENKFISAK